MYDIFVFEPLNHFHQGKEYSLDLKSKKCNVTALTRPFRPFGIPPEGQFEGEANIGLSGVAGEFMTVANFAGNFTDGDKFAGVVTLPDCVPVANAFFSKDSGFVSRQWVIA